MSEDSQQEPKIIIDEDWKEQVQREKEMAAKGEIESPAAVDAKVADDSKPSDSGDDDSAEDIPQNLPPATFDFLVTMLATQAMVAMGQMPGASGKPEKVQKPLAKHYIDLLGTLEEKTKGNLETHEQKLLGGILHELRMTFLRV